MKNFKFNNSCIGASFRHLGIVISLLTVGLLFTEVAYADYWAGFFGSKAENAYLKYKTQSSDEDYTKVWICGSDGCGSTGVNDYDLGTVTELYMDAFWAATWKKTTSGSSTHWGDVCSVTMYYTLDSWTNTHHYNCYVRSTDQSTSGSITTYNQYWGSKDGESANIDLIGYTSGDPGNYTLKYNFSGKFKRNEVTSGDCSTTLKLDNGEAHYKVNFSIPGFTSGPEATTISVDAAASSGTAAITYQHYGTALTASNFSFTSIGSDENYFSVESISETGATIRFTPPTTTGTYTATLTITDPNGATSTDAVTITGKIKNQTVVLIAAKPVVADGPQVTLQGYLKNAGCIEEELITNIKTYGFVYSTDEASVTSGGHIETTGSAISSGSTWTNTIASGLKENTTYYYKPYVQYETSGSETVKRYSTECGTFTTGGGCVYPTGEVITYTIDDDFTYNDPCALKFNNIDDAFLDLVAHNGENNDDWWDKNNKMLKVEVVFDIEPGTYGTSGNIIDFANLNRYSGTILPTRRFTAQGTDPDNKPVLYGMDLSNARWVTIKDLRIVRETTGTGLSESTILLGFADASNNRTVGEISDADIRFINCDIVADAFCCIHVNGLDGLYMENCNLEAKRTTTIVDNDRNWGASIKFMNCSNIKLLRNNFRGSHANNIFFQNSRNALIMNNVFWNDNAITYSSSTNSPAFIRLVNFGADDDAHKITGVGMYYNTFYLANSDAASEDSKKFDYLVFSGTAQNGINTRYDVANINFQYNNCYSYSTHILGGTTSPFGDFSIGDVFKKNNFWSAATSSDFSFGTEKQNIDMSLSGGMVCQNAPFDPDGLIIKGSSLNLGSKVANDVSGLGAEKITSDRANEDIRPDGSTWTYGAYQQSVSSGKIKTIIWNGIENGDWDNRNNWVKEDGKVVSCVDVLDEELRVIIPAPGSTAYTHPTVKTITRYPSIPAWTDIENGEEVRAGNGVSGYAPTMFAHTIELEYGAPIKGVENLKEVDDETETYRYNEADNHFIAQRKEWILVGTVIRPFSGDTITRLVQSGDFYLNAEPQVYMQQVTTKGSEDSKSITWGTPFPSLTTEVPSDKCFAIYLPDQYGPKKRSAKSYYKVGDSRRDDGTVAKQYDFSGRFANEQGMPTYSFKEGYNFANNSYPANVYASAFDNDDNTVKVYTYPSDVSTIAGAGGWDDYINVSSTYEIKPQNGFVVVATADNEITPDDDAYTISSTKYRGTVAMSGVSLLASNAAVDKGSRIGVWYEYKNIQKAENADDEEVCELYIPGTDYNLSTMSISSLEAEIPLGIHNKMSKAMTVKFTLTQQPGMESVVLEDRAASPIKEYDLLAGEAPVFAAIPSGYLEGRFYLVLNGGPDTPTDVPSVDDGESGIVKAIDIYSDGGAIVISSSDNVMLKSAVITDMAGRSTVVELNNAHYNKFDINGAQGVYVINAIGDVMSETTKVIVK